MGREGGGGGAKRKRERKTVAGGAAAPTGGGKLAARLATEAEKERTKGARGRQDGAF